MNNQLYNIEMTRGDIKTVINGYPLPFDACQRMIDTLGGDTAKRQFEILKA